MKIFYIRTSLHSFVIFNVIIDLHSSNKTVTDRTNILSTANSQRAPLILLYHKLHGKPNWWFRGAGRDFEHCRHHCRVTSNRSLYAQADMVLFEGPRAIKKKEGLNKTFLEYYQYVRYNLKMMKLLPESS